MKTDAAARSLLDRGLAYPCVCTRGEILAALSAPHQGEPATVYPGTCRGRFTSLADADGAAAGSVNIALERS